MVLIKLSHLLGSADRADLYISAKWSPPTQRERKRERERERERERFLQNLNAVNCVDYISTKHSVKNNKRDWDKKKKSNTV